jgi:HD-like signal output (HDOD) protein
MNNRKKVFDKLDSLNALKSPPSSLTEVLALIGQESFSVSELSSIILKDPDLSDRILRVANSSFYGHRQEITSIEQAISSFYGHRQEITSIEQAIMIIGPDNVKFLLLSIAVYTGLTSKKSGNFKNPGRLWRHLLETAVVAKNAARVVNYSAADEAYVAGLLHDFGKVFLLRYFPGEYDEICRL